MAAPYAALENVLFLLAHPDDDLFVRPLIERSRGAVVAYVAAETARTNGRRRREALGALAALGLDAERVLFPGEAANARDGRVIARLDAVFDALRAALAKLDGQVGSIVTHAWEGGHPDHDAAHLVALKLARGLGVADTSHGCAFYRAAQTPLLPYHVQTPHPEAAGYRRVPLRFAEAFAAAAAARRYPSQWRALTVFAPFLMARAFVDRSLYLQPLSQSIAPARPPGARLLSETRFATPFEVTAAAATAFLSAP